MSRPKLKLLFGSFLLLLIAASQVSAHEMRPAYLEIKETAPGVYEVTWKVPLSPTGERPGLQLVLPDDCEITAAPRTVFAGNSHLERSQISRPGGLQNTLIRVDGLDTAPTDVLVRVESLAGLTQVTRLGIDNASFMVEAFPRRMDFFRTYLTLGIEHILLGVDHLLFVLGLLLIVRGRWRLLKTITAFTIAHSLTLALATLELARAPARPLEAGIALSIFFLGLEIARTWRGQTSLSIERPWLVAFGFGLLHGFGFATGLSATGVPQSELPVALLSFNLGVEAGQVGFVGIVLALVWSFQRLEITWPKWVTRVPGYGIGSLGAFWSLQRIFAIFGFTP